MCIIINLYKKAAVNLLEYGALSLYNIVPKYTYSSSTDLIIVKHAGTNKNKCLDVTVSSSSRVQEPYRGRARFFQILIFYMVTRPKLMFCMQNFKGFPMP